MTPPYPVSLERTPDGLAIGWSDGQSRVYKLRELRDGCPCATCNEKRRGKEDQPADPFAILTPAEARPLAIDSMRPIGQYAYGIAFSDGHDTGIFTFELLRTLGQART